MKKQEDEKPADNNTHGDSTDNTHGDSTVLIVNPSSSSGSTGKNWDDLYIKIKEIFRENPDVVFSKKSGDGTTLAREYLKKGFKNIVEIGGDGTINEVANGFFFFDEESDARGGRTHISTSDDNIGCNTTTITANTPLPDQPILRQVNPDAVFGIVSSGTRNVLFVSFYK